MTPASHRLLALLCTAAILVCGADLAAYAATGDPLIGGRANTRNTATTVVRQGPGPALRLRTETGSAPLAVSSSTRVTRLNADRVDGLDGRALQTASVRYRVPTSGPYDFAVVTFPKLPEGVWLASYTFIATSGGNSRGPTCFFRQSNSKLTARGLSLPAVTTDVSSTNATTLIDTRNGAFVTLGCGGQQWSFLSQQGDAQSTVSFTSVDTMRRREVNVRDATPARAAPLSLR
jgi:hypothetical protein